MSAATGMIGLDPETLLGYVSEGKDYARRAAAMEALGRSGADSLATVVRGVRGNDPDTSMFCLQVLSRIDHEEARAVLREAVSHPDVLLSQAAIEGIGTQRDRLAVPLLIGLLAEEREFLEMDPWRAISAIIALGRIGSSEALAALLPLRASDIFRETVDEALGSIRSAEGARA